MPKTTVTDWKELEIHPFANRFRMMSELEFEALKEDISQNGVQEEILLYRGKILDGRNRFRACIELEKEGRLPPGNPKFDKFDGSEEDAGRHVTSLNLMRRHLTKSEKAMTLVLDGLVALPPTDGTRRQPGTGRDSIMEVGRRYGVNHMTLYKAAYIRAHDEDLARAVAEGKYSVPVAEKMIRNRVENEDESKSESVGDLLSIASVAKIVDECALLDDALSNAERQKQRLGKLSALDRSEIKTIERAINQIRDILEHCRPSSICGACKGKGCENCSHRGWMTIPR